MKILICGSRHWSNKKSIEDFLNGMPRQTTVIHDGCRGADNIAGEVAVSLGMNVIVFYANWKDEGKSAGPKRNARMLDEGKPDLIVAFHESIETSKGTKDMIKRAKVAGIDIKIITE